MKNQSNILSYLRVPAAALCNIVLTYIWFMLARVIFYIENHSYYNEIPFSSFGEIAKGGFMFDTSAICYLNSLYLLLMLIPLYTKERDKYQKVTKWIFLVVNSAALLMNLMDTVYFQFTNRRTTASVFSEFSNDNNIAGIIGYEVANHWYLTITGIILIYLLCKLYREPYGRPMRKSWVYYTSQVVPFAIALPLIVVGMRGGVGADIRPITISNANQYVNRPVETALVLNTPFAILRTIDKKPFTVPTYFTDEKEMESVYSPLHQPSNVSGGKGLNVVVLIMESFGKEYIGALNKELENGNYKGYTPFLDSLINESLTFEYSYANGRKSIDGMPSILSGIPMFVEPFFLTPSSMNEVSGIAGELRKDGYYTAFFHGAVNGSMGFEAFARATGFEDYYGRTEYNNDDDFDGRWAIWDEEFLGFYADKMATFKQPFATAIFTASSHHPYVVPSRYEGVFPEGTQPIHKCVGYSDNALRHFFAKASKMKWFKNTLFVITADHTNQTDHAEYLTSSGTFAVPIIFYRPGSDMKGHINAIAQQIDIMPTVLNYLGYDKPYVAFGCDLFNTPADKTYAVNYFNGIYQYFNGDYMLQFDGDKSIALYNIADDRLLKHDILREQQEVAKEMERKLKAIIQQYMERMNQDRLTAK
jgi:phosphoglycerol transferase MdoB-like AlkP superfamily enzyme